MKVVKKQEKVLRERVLWGRGKVRLVCQYSGHIIQLSDQAINFSLTCNASQRIRSEELASTTCRYPFINFAMPHSSLEAQSWQAQLADTLH